MREKWILIFSIFLSILTTALSLCPPYLTQVLVDNILPDGMNGLPTTSLYGWILTPAGALTAIAIGLAAIYVVQHIIGGVSSYL